MSRFLYNTLLTLFLSASAYVVTVKADSTIIDVEPPTQRQESSNQMMTATGKQRLSTKGQDDNRVNDCRVDEEFRQGKTRGAVCKHEHITQHLEK